MPRQARLETPGIPLHITQRGVHRCAIILDVDECRYCLGLPTESAAKHGRRIHAYVLMGIRVRLLDSFDDAANSRWPCAKFDKPASAP
jgi:putative transposase